MRRLAVSVLLITTISAISLATTIHIPDDQSTIQAGLNTAVEGDTVLVASGTYVENIIWPAVNGIKLIGSGQEDCIIDGDSLGSVIRFEEDLGGIIDSSTLITGFVIQNGFSSVGGGIYFFTANPQLIDVTISGNTGYRGGGGIHCLYSNPTLTNVMITDNLAGPAEGSAGGGICCLGSNPTLTNVIITNNSVYAVWGAGSGIYCHNSCPTLSNVTISGNLGVFWGGGIACRGVSNPVLTNVTITGNGAYWGGGIYCQSDCNLVLDGVLISYNHAFYVGGGIYCYGNSATLTNVTISENTADDDGGGIYSTDSNPVLENCILWGNTPGEISGEATVSCSDVQGGWEGENNIDADPLFCDPENGDYRLQLQSPCRTDICGVMGHTTAFCEGENIEDLRISYAVTGELQLFWTAVPQADRYHVYYSETNSGAWPLEATVLVPYYTRSYPGGNGFFTVTWEED